MTDFDVLNFCPYCQDHTFRSGGQCLECGEFFHIYKRPSSMARESIETAFLDESGNFCQEQVVLEKFLDCEAAIYGVAYPKNFGFIKRNVINFSEGIVSLYDDTSIGIDDYFAYSRFPWGDVR